MRLKRNELGRFMAKVLGTSECWIWRGSKDKCGYGRFRRANNFLDGAHRFAYEQFVGPIPEGMEIDHVKERGCVSRAVLCCLM